MRNPALWLYLLGTVTFLVVMLRRVLHRQMPLSDEIYAQQVAIDHVHSGVAWVGSDGLVSSINPAIAKTLALLPLELLGQPWNSFFPPGERNKVEDAYRQALLMGKTALETQVQRPDGTLRQVSVLLVTVHDHNLRLVGHHWLMQDRTREVELEEQIQKLAGG